MKLCFFRRSLATTETPTNKRTTRTSHRLFFFLLTLLLLPVAAAVVSSLEALMSVRQHLDIVVDIQGLALAPSDATATARAASSLLSFSNRKKRSFLSFFWGEKTSRKEKRRFLCDRDFFSLLFLGERKHRGRKAPFFFVTEIFFLPLFRQPHLFFLFAPFERRRRWTKEHGITQTYCFHIVCFIY